MRRGRGGKVETQGFDTARARQREEARRNWVGSGEAQTETVWFELREKLGATEFLGYDTQVAEGKIASLEEVFQQGWKIREPEMVKKLVPDLSSEVVYVGIVQKQTDAGELTGLGAVVAGGTASREDLVGQFGNPVVVLARLLEAAPDIRSTWRRWTGARLPEALQPDLDARLDDDGVLHFRLDKQRAAVGELVLLREGDAIDAQVKLRAYPAKPEEIRKVARGLVPEAV